MIQFCLHFLPTNVYADQISAKDNNYVSSTYTNIAMHPEHNYTSHKSLERARLKEDTEVVQTTDGGKELHREIVLAKQEVRAKGGYNIGISVTITNN